MTTVTDQASPELCEHRAPFLRQKSGLTPSEVDVMRALAAGQNNTSIGRLLNIDETAVRLHLSRGYSKLGVCNRIEAMCAVLEGALE